MDRFSEQLRARQGAQNDADFAARLGVTQSYWTRVKNGTRPISARIARLAIAQWPELEDLYLADVRDTLRPRAGDRFAGQQRTA